MPSFALKGIHVLMVIDDMRSWDYPLDRPISEIKEYQDAKSSYEKEDEAADVVGSSILIQIQKFLADSEFNGPSRRTACRLFMACLDDSKLFSYHICKVVARMAAGLGDFRQGKAILKEMGVTTCEDHLDWLIMHPVEMVVFEQEFAKSLRIVGRLEQDVDPEPEAQASRRSYEI